LEQRANLEEKLEKAREHQAQARAENPLLKSEMDELKARMNQLKEVKGADCPLCGQPMGKKEREALIEKLHQDGTQMGDKFRDNKKLLVEIDTLVQDYQNQIQTLRKEEVEVRKYYNQLAELRSQLDHIEKQKQDWEANGAPRLQTIRAALAAGDYAYEARLQLAEVDEKLKEIGYDAAAHDAVRRDEELGRSSETDLRALEKAQSALKPLIREIADLEKQILDQKKQIKKLEVENQTALAALEKAQKEAPSIFCTR